MSELVVQKTNMQKTENKETSTALRNWVAGDVSWWHAVTQCPAILDEFPGFLRDKIKTVVTDRGMTPDTWAVANPDLEGKPGAFHLAVASEVMRQHLPGFEHLFWHVHVPRPDLEIVLGELLEAKADVNYRASDGSTPLMWARSEKAIKWLLEHKADCNLKDSSGRTVAQYLATEFPQTVYSIAANGETDMDSGKIDILSSLVAFLGTNYPDKTDGLSTSISSQ